MLAQGVLLFAAVVGLQAMLAQSVERELASIAIRARDDSAR